MNKGSELYCKKDFTIFFTAGKKYEIDCVNLSDDIGNLYICLKNNSGGTFCLSIVEDPKLYYIWDFFYTENEMRSMKLDKLNLMK